jgi:hypothetical protein
MSLNSSMTKGSTIPCLGVIATDRKGVFVSFEPLTCVLSVNLSIYPAECVHQQESLNQGKCLLYHT